MYVTEFATIKSRNLRNVGRQVGHTHVSQFHTVLNL